MKSEETIKIKPQEVITLFRDIKIKGDEAQAIHYPELEDLFKDGFYVESFNQAFVGTDRFIITFVLRKFNKNTY
jgi:hypothetical protein